MDELQLGQIVSCSPHDSHRQESGKIFFKQHAVVLD